MEREIGTVKWFNRQRGFGFATTDTDDVFLHYSEIKGDGFRTLEEGERISFLRELSDRGPKAVDIEVISGGLPLPSELLGGRRFWDG